MSEMCTLSFTVSCPTPIPSENAFGHIPFSFPCSLLSERKRSKSTQSSLEGNSKRQTTFHRKLTVVGGSEVSGGFLVGKHSRMDSKLREHKRLEGRRDV